MILSWLAATCDIQFSARHTEWRAHAFTTANSHSRAFFISPLRSLPLFFSLLFTLIQIYQNAAWPLMPQLTSCWVCFSLLLGDTKQLLLKTTWPSWGCRVPRCPRLYIWCFLLDSKHISLFTHCESTNMKSCMETFDMAVSQQLCRLHHAVLPKPN